MLTIILIYEINIIRANKLIFYYYYYCPSLFIGKLIVCYDDNLITIDGDTSLSFTEDVNARYLSYGWHVQTVSDANDIPSLR